MIQEIARLALETVIYEKKGAIAYVTLNRPKVLNALNKTALADLRAAFEDARDDSSLHGVILTGAGDKSFIAGADINEVATDTPVQAEETPGSLSAHQRGSPVCEKVALQALTAPAILRPRGSRCTARGDPYTEGGWPATLREPAVLR